MPKQTHTAPSSSCGISTAIGIRLAQHGTDPVVNYFSSTSATWKVVEQIRSYGTTTIIVKADMSHEEKIKCLCQCVMTEFDQPSIIMSNSSIEHLGTLPDVTVRDIDEVGLFFIAQQAYKCLTGYSRLILTLSLSPADSGHKLQT
ncbi:hypothetical protein BDV37DRAFT_281821 [Aspergillus pseudonomiae]|uniref:Ketoreductase (KR) domain-containing protein n=1 Tax=Aspergillus pseudonomiae TaxID=1506151 RepID=A0A5N7DGJ5_9EURO|nr:uncharacterized protein BDV37DRAFT_281821 [Aspergillus pseudonomiae]KAE8405414.1 hypothetical protein BDV37DRAFT_281821 [Aspergillus pseudonomiae]